MMALPWYHVSNVADLPSPALLVYPERIDENIRRMVDAVGAVDRLRPHVKTHKMAEVLRRQMRAGISKFKCATIAEAEMCGQGGATDVLLAYQPVGPNVARLIRLQAEFPKTRFSTIIDDLGALHALSHAAKSARQQVKVLLDIDCGMHRSGVPAGAPAMELYRHLADLPGIIASGLHVYDGHIHEPDLQKRIEICEAAFAPIEKLRSDLTAAGLPVRAIIVGGTPTFPIHARRSNVECSPGTCVFWDHGYASKFPDLEFIPAAILLTRVVSRPGPNRLCLDLGHKAVAAENPPPRVYFPEIPEALAISHSEEHLVIETPSVDTFAVGQAIYGVPWHICPTVALHAEAVVVTAGKATGHWKTTSRDRRLTV